MAAELFRRAFALLDDTQLAEEDRVDAVEELVGREAPQMAAGERERLVLDMLMAHHHKRTPEEAARPQLQARPSKPVKLPDMPRKAPTASKPAPTVLAPTVPAQSRAPVQQPVQHSSVLTAASRASAAVPAPASTPYDELRAALGPQNSNEDIDRALAHNDYDLGRTLEMLSGGEEQAADRPSKEQVAERIMCKYYMTSGNCLRGSACMYSHEGKQRICRFWLQGHCLAGDQCLFLHSVPAEVLERFETKPEVRPTLPSLDALPALGAKRQVKANAKPQAKLQNVAPLPKPTVQFKPISQILSTPNKGRVPLVVPKVLPWKRPEFANNQKYVDLRLAAAKHAELRNKFLLQATTAWSQNDPAKARTLSAEGQFHNEEMMDAYHRGADLLWDQRKTPSSEIYVDLHGLELGEAVDQLEARLREVEASEKHNPRVVYVITGRGHFRAKRVADQLSQYVKAFVDKHGYKHHDFGVDTTFGRVFGVDPWSAIR